MADPRTIWTFANGATSVSFFQLVGDEYNERFDGKWNYTKDLVLGATTSAQVYYDLGAFDIAPLTLRCELTTSADRQTLQGMHGTEGTLSNTNGRSYTALLVQVTRIENGGMYLVDAVWEAH